MSIGQELTIYWAVHMFQVETEAAARGKARCMIDVILPNRYVNTTCGWFSDEEVKQIVNREMARGREVEAYRI
jgi:hypothetical protein